MNKNHIKIWVAVDVGGEGYVLNWEGCKTDGSATTLSTHAAFAKDPSAISTTCGDLGSACLGTPGLHLFEGKMHHAHEDVVFTGKWTLLYKLPLETDSV